MSHHLQLTLSEAMSNNLSESFDMRDLLLVQSLDYRTCEAGTHAPLDSCTARWELVRYFSGFIGAGAVRNFGNFLHKLCEFVKFVWKIIFNGDAHSFLTAPNRFTHFKYAVWIAHLTFWTLTLEFLDWLVKLINAIFIRKKDVTRERSC